MRRQQRGEPARRLEVGDVLQRDRPLERDERVGRVGERQRVGVGAALDRPRQAVADQPGRRSHQRRPRARARGARRRIRARARAPSSTRWTASAAAGATSAAYSHPAGHVAVAHVAQLVRHDDADLVAAVAVEQGVEQHDPLGRAEPGHVGVGRGGAPAGVDRVHLPHLDAGRRARARARRSAFRPRASGVKSLNSGSSTTGASAARRGAERHRAGRRRQPPAARIPPRHRHSGGAAPAAAQRGLDRAALEQIAAQPAPGLRDQPDRHPTLAGDRRQRQRGSDSPTARPAPVAAPPAAGRSDRRAEPPRRPSHDERERADLDRRAASARARAEAARTARRARSPRR